MTELIGILTLRNLTRILDIKDMDLYKDNGLVVIREPNVPKIDRFGKR